MPSLDLIDSFEFSPITISTVANPESDVPSFTRKVKLSVPIASALAVYTRFGAVPLRVPCFGCEATV